jgi:uncharacterized protein YdhG (YjbR/CyaY superfamily)
MSTAFSKEEKAAMKAAIAEAKAVKEGADLEAACLDSIAKMTGRDKELAEIVHKLVTTNSDLKPKTYYGMPAYANADGKVIVFFQNAGKFKVRYATLGFQPDAKLDDGTFWPTSWGVTKLGPAEQKKIVQLVKKAVGA